MTPLRVGIVGCGNISGIYFQNLKAFDETEVVACADLDEARAREVAAKQGVEARSTADLMSSNDIDLVLNLTVPKAHAEVALRALEAGKHVYNEKPLTIEREDGRKVLELANAKGLRVGCAPDSFLGAGIQDRKSVV